MSMIIRGSGGSGKGGGQQQAPVETPDNLKSDQFAVVLDLLSEGEIEGLVNGLQSIYLDDVPLQNADGTFNFEGVSVETRSGTAGQTAIGMIAGTEAESSVGVEVKAAQPIERSITNPEVDRVRVTIGIPQLASTDTSNGNINGTTVQYRIGVSSNGGPFVDASIGGGSWTPFTGLTTPSPAQHLRAAIRWTPNRRQSLGLNQVETATVRLEYSGDGGGTWLSAGQLELSSGTPGQPQRAGMTAAIVGQLQPAQTVTSGLLEVIGAPLATYQLRAVLVSTTEASPGTVEVVSQATGIGSTVGTITGKTSSRFQRSHVVNLRAFGNPPYVVRVSRQTPDSTSSALLNRTFWDSYTEIVDERLRYPHSALVAMRMSSAQFPGIPTRGFHIRGIKIKIPSNYDPIRRTYTGMWDGTFVVAWSNNPAWIFYDLITNNRYGVGDRIPLALTDKWALYTIAQYCDEMVPDGRGGVEPRYTFNYYIQTREQAYRALVNIASVFRGMVFWSASAIVASADMPRDPVYQFTNANVVDGVFNYQGSNIRVRRNVALVTWNDPADMYRTKVEYVSDDDAIAAMGYVNQVEVTAIGCTSQGQARRVGEWIIYTERFENETVSFDVGLDGNIPRPGDVIQIADSLKTGARLGGRVVSANRAAVLLDNPVQLAANSTLTIIRPDATLESRPVKNPPGLVGELYPATDFTTAPEPGSIWIVSDPGAEAQTFRVLGVAEKEDGRVYSIQGLRHYPDKFDFIERDKPLAIPDYTRLDDLWSPPQPPTDVALVESLYVSARGVLSKLTVSWQPPANRAVEQFELQYRIGAQDNWITVPPTKETSYEIQNLNDRDAVYVAIRSVTGVGVRSAIPATASTTILGKQAPPANVTGFTVTRAGNTLNFGWQHIADIDRDRYEIRFGSAWTSAVPVGATSANAFSVESIRGGTFLIKAFDTSGNASAGATSVTVGDSTAFLNSATHDESTGGWNGACTNCAPFSLSATVGWGDLASWSAFTAWNAGASRTGILMNAGATGDAIYVGETISLASKQRVQVSLNVSIGALSGGVVPWAALVGPWTAYTSAWPTYGGGATVTFADAIRATIQIQTSDDAITWSQAFDFTPGVYYARHFRFVIRMNSSDPALLPYLFGLEARFDLRERQLRFEDAAIALAGTALSFNPPFVAIRTIQITNQGGATGDTSRTSGKSNSGVTINCFTSAGAAKAAVVDVDVFGYGET